MPLRSRLLASLVTLSLGPAALADDPAPKPVDGASIAERAAKIIAEYEVLKLRATEESRKIVDKAESSRVYSEVFPGYEFYARSLIDLAETSPADPASRDALLWVVYQPSMGGTSIENTIARAAITLVAHHADAPEVASVCLSLDGQIGRGRDALLEGVYAGAKGHEAKGLARLALAQYLAFKADFAAVFRKLTDTGMRRIEVYDDKGKRVEKRVETSIEERAYRFQVSLCDADQMRSKANQLFAEVGTEYAEVPHLTHRHRLAAAELKAMPPADRDDPKQAKRRADLQKYLDRQKTLGEVVAGRVEDLHLLAVGQPAPEIDGPDIEGKPMKLSDYRGQVVMVVFWGSWCAPCMRQIPHERELVERMKGKPFALLGVHCDEDKDVGVRTIAREKLAWPHWHDGAPGKGPISTKYQVRAYPYTLILDPKGQIRYEGHASGEGQAKLVDELLKEVEKAGPAK